MRGGPVPRSRTLAQFAEIGLPPSASSQRDVCKMSRPTERQSYRSLIDRQYNLRDGSPPQSPTG
jgi:hypothetical protein